MRSVWVVKDYESGEVRLFSSRKKVVADIRLTYDGYITHDGWVKIKGDRSVDNICAYFWKAKVY